MYRSKFFFAILSFVSYSAFGFGPSFPQVSKYERFQFALRSSIRGGSSLPEQSSDLFVKCSNCSSYYSISLEDLGTQGSRLKCSVCSHTWYQSPSRAFKLEKGFITKNLSAERIDEIRSTLSKKSNAGVSPSGKRKKGEISLFVGNLPFSVSEQDIVDIFKSYGDVISAIIVKDNMDRSRGYGFVEMAKREDGLNAIEMLQDFKIKGRPIAVRDGNSKTPRQKN